MKLKEFLNKCTFEEFKEWFKDRCIGFSFDNIQEGKSFKALVINKLSDNKEYAYYLIIDRDNLEELYHELVNYNNEEDQDLFILNDDTRFFVYSYSNQLFDSNNEPINIIKEALTSLRED